MEKTDNLTDRFCRILGFFLYLCAVFIGDMDKTKNMKFAKSVMLIDVAFLNSVISDLRSHFSRILGRELQTIDLSALVSYIALDAGISQEALQQIQVLLIYDDLSAKILYTQPSDVENELNDVAFRNELGEFSFYSFRPEQFISVSDFFAESFRIIASDKNVCKLWTVGELSEQILEDGAISKGFLSSKEIVMFRMSEPAATENFRWELLGYPVMRALGIRGDELSE